MFQLKSIVLVQRASLVAIIAFMSILNTGISAAIAQPSVNTYIVNSTADLPDVDVGIGTCLASNGKCTLRAAIMQANFTAGADIINLPAGTYTLTRFGNDDADVLGDLDITDDLTIQGAGSSLTIVDGNGAVTGDRGIQILNTAKAVTLNGLTVENGKRTATFDEGGGIYWDGSGSSLHLNDVVIKNNTAYYGGGIYLNYSTMGDQVVIDHSIVQGNAATAAAGGLGVNFGDFASFSLSNSQIHNNSAYQGGGLYFQGTIINFDLNSVQLQNIDLYSNTASLSAGIENRSGSSTVPVNLINSHIHNNQASFYGGGIGNYGVLAISTSTLDANSATSRGGGLYNYEGGVTNITQSTLSGNSSTTGAGIYTEFFIHNTSLVTLTNSTLSSNTASQDGGAIYADGGQVGLYNATIDSNRILVPTGITYIGMGGGIYTGAHATAAIQNSLLAENTHQYQALPAVNDDCYGSVDFLGFDLIQTVSNCTNIGTTSGNINGQSPHLSPLRNNGGATLTQALLPGSPAINAGHSPSCNDANGAPILVDQRGFRRPIGATCDIGAVEFTPYVVYLSTIHK